MLEEERTRPRGGAAADGAASGQRRLLEAAAGRGARRDVVGQCGVLILLLREVVLVRVRVRVTVS